MSITVIYGYKFNEEQLVEFYNEYYYGSIEQLDLPDELVDLLKLYCEYLPDPYIVKDYKKFYLTKNLIKIINEDFDVHSDDDFEPDLIFGVKIKQYKIKNTLILSYPNIKQNQSDKITELRKIYPTLGEPQIYYVINKK
jgi:hypothetical protein